MPATEICSTPANIHISSEKITILLSEKCDNTSLLATHKARKIIIEEEHCSYVQLCTSSIHRHKCIEIYLTLNPSAVLGSR
jgi:hypothetical protein